MIREVLELLEMPASIGVNSIEGWLRDPGTKPGYGILEGYALNR
jgi:hypothetical protein